MKTKLIYDALTGKQTVEPLSENELAEIDLLAEEAKQQIALQKQIVAAKQRALEKFKALGLTEEEIAALVG